MTDPRRQLLELHPESFRWSLTCCGGDREEAMDVLQSCYVRILDGRAPFRGRSSFKTWLFAVIRRTAATKIRREKARARRLEEHGNGRVAEPSLPDPELRAERLEQATRIRNTLRRLPPRQREILDLVFYHDLSLAETAAVLGISTGTASVHYDRGKKEMLRLLKDEERCL